MQTRQLGKEDNTTGENMSRYSLFVLISQGWKRNCLLNKHTHAVQGGLKDLNYVALYPKVNPSQLV